MPMSFEEQLALDAPWSIEWVEVRHHGESIAGTMWRIYKDHFERRWTFSGQYHTIEILGYYRATRGEGGRGNFALMLLNKAVLKGGFQERQVLFESVSARRAHIRSEYRGMPLEWVRVGSGEQERIHAWLNKIRLDEVVSKMPKRIRIKLERTLGNRPKRDFLHKFRFPSITKLIKQ